MSHFRFQRVSSFTDTVLPSKQCLYNRCGEIAVLSINSPFHAVKRVPVGLQHSLLDWAVIETPDTSAANLNGHRHIATPAPVKQISKRPATSKLSLLGPNCSAQRETCSSFGHPTATPTRSFCFCTGAYQPSNHRRTRCYFCFRDRATVTSEPVSVEVATTSRVSQIGAQRVSNKTFDASCSIPATFVSCSMAYRRRKSLEAGFERCLPFYRTLLRPPSTYL